MRKTRFIAVILIVAVILMGAGYAYWTQELKITGTVGTGELKVEFLELMILDDHGSYDNVWPFMSDYMNVDLGFTEDKLTAEFKDIYPGAGGFLRFRIANTGTVPAKVVGITPENIVGQEYLDEFNYIVETLRIYTPKNGFGWHIKDSWPYINYGYYEWTQIDLEGWPIFADDFDDFVTQLSNRLSQYTLEPFAFFEINGEGSGYHILLPGEDTTNQSMPQGETIEFDLVINFEQAR